MSAADLTKLVPAGPRISLTEVVVGQLTRLILDGQYKPGDRLPSEFELADRIQVSRGTIREALKALGLVGLVHAQRGKGTVVAERSDFMVRPMSLAFNTQADLKAVIEARGVIESELAGFAAERASLADIQLMGSCLDSMKNGEDVGTIVKSDIDFHFAIARAAHSPLLGQFLTSLKNILELWCLLRSKEVNLLEEHLKVFEAIRDKKPDEAKRLMYGLIESSGKIFIRLRRAQALDDINDGIAI